MACMACLTISFSLPTAVRMKPIFSVLIPFVEFFLQSVWEVSLDPRSVLQLARREERIRDRRCATSEYFDLGLRKDAYER